MLRRARRSDGGAASSSQHGKQRDVSEHPLPVRLVIARLIDEEGWIVAPWTLLTNVVTESADAAQIALWY